MYFIVILVFIFPFFSQRSVAQNQSEGAFQGIIVFDKGGVLTKKDFSQAYSYIQHTLHLSGDELKKIQQIKKLERISHGHFWESYVKKNNHPVSPEWPLIVKNLFLLGRAPNIETLILIEELFQKKYRLGMLSNTTPETSQFNRMIGYYSYFIPCILSNEMGLRKPDARFFQLLITAVNLPPQEIIFIDDKEKNIQAAQSLGIDAIHFTTAENLRHALAKRGVKI